MGKLAAAAAAAAAGECAVARCGLLQRLVLELLVPVPVLAPAATRAPLALLALAL